MPALDATSALTSVLVESTPALLLCTSPVLFRPEKVMVPEEVMPVAAVMAPPLLTAKAVPEVPAPSVPVVAVLPEASTVNCPDDPTVSVPLAVVLPAGETVNLE